MTPDEFLTGGLDTEVRAFSLFTQNHSNRMEI